MRIKMEDYLVSIIVEAKENGEKLPVDDIINLLMRNYCIPQLTRKKRTKLIELINRIKMRIIRRRQREKAALEMLAKDALVSIKLIERWAGNGLIEITGKTAKVRDMIQCFRERDYYLGIKMQDEDFPADHSEPLWEK